MRASAESPNVRITPRSKEVLRALAKQEGKSMQAILDEAIEKYEQDKILDAMNAAYAAVRSDPKAWKQEQAERALWDQTLADGLENE